VEDESTHKEEQPKAYGITTCQGQVTEVTDTKPPAKVTGAKQPAKVTDAKQPAKQPVKPAPCSDANEMASVTLCKKNKKNNKK